LIEFTLGPTRVGNCPEQRKKRFERLQGDPRMIRSPRIDSDFFRLRNPPPPVAPQNVEWCCIWDSVQSVEQPWGRWSAIDPAPSQRALFMLYYLFNFNKIGEKGDWHMWLARS